MACAGPDLENRITMLVLIQILGFLPRILSAMAADVISLFFEREGGAKRQPPEFCPKAAEEDEKRSSPLVHDFLHGDHDP